MLSCSQASRARKPTALAALAPVALLVIIAGWNLGDLGGARAGSTLADDPTPEGWLIYLPLSLRSGAYNQPAPTTSPAPTAPSPVHTASPPAPTTPAPTATSSPAPPVNECADPAADWVFCDDFEAGATWDGSVKDPVVRANPGPLGAEGNHVAELRVPPGPGGNGLWKKLPPSDRLYARWYVQWEPGHDLTARHHGPGGLGADTAWYTGRSGIRPAGDEYFVSTIEPSTVSPHYIYAYTYYRGMFMDCADPNGRCWGDHFPCYAGPRYCTRPEYLPKVEQAGTATSRWYCIEQMIDAGSPVADGARADGQLDFWIDGLQIGPWTDLWWRTVPSLKINLLWLFLYHHDDRHSVEGVRLDDVVVSTSRVGCRP